MSNSTKDKLLKKILIEGRIKILTGLHIGGTSSGMDIGGIDRTVIRNAINNQPYIPGSSLKGKMRSLLEIAMATYGDTRMGKVHNGPGDNPTKLSTQLFGSARGDSDQRPSRVIVRDGHLTSGDEDMKLLQAVQFAETKTEVVIDRITAAAMPRQMERVPAGAEFSLNIVLNIFESDDEKELVKTLLRSLLLVQDDYLGGNGSRGSGQVAFGITSIKEKNYDFYLTGKATDEALLYDTPKLEAVVPSEFLK